MNITTSSPFLRHFLLLLSQSVPFLYLAVCLRRARECFNPSILPFGKVCSCPSDLNDSRYPILGAVFCCTVLEHWLSLWEPEASLVFLLRVNLLFLPPRCLDKGCPWSQRLDKDVSVSRIPYQDFLEDNVFRLDFFAQLFQGTVLHGMEFIFHALCWVLLPWEHLLFVLEHLCLPHLLVSLKLLSFIFTGIITSLSSKSSYHWQIKSFFNWEKFSSIISIH